MKKVRRIIQVAAAPLEDSCFLYVLCDDGTLWAFYGNEGGYKRLLDVPQSALGPR